MSVVLSFSLILGIHSNAGALSAPAGNMLAFKMVYVSPTGSDTNSGTSTSPFKTFTKAVSTLVAGDTLQVMPGTYNETLTLSLSGTESAPINVIGGGAILNMLGTKANGIVISGSYINLSRFEVIGATDFGILVTGKRVTIENNIVHDNVTKNGVGTCGLSTTWGSALKVKVGGESTIIRGNTVYNNCGEGIAVTRGVIALVENNTVYDNFGVNIYVDNSPFVTVQNNMSYCTGTHLRDGKRATGIALGEESYSGWGAQLHDILISGNTITECRSGISAYESNVGGTLKNVTIINNSIPSGQVRSISLQTLTNENVLVSFNLIFNTIYVYNMTGVTLGENSASTSAPTPTSTAALPTSTPTSLPTATPTMPVATITASPAPVLPTATQTVAMPTVVVTAPTEPVLPTATATPIPVEPTIIVVPTNPPTLETNYDENDGAFVYSANWESFAKRQAYGGTFKQTTKKDSFVTFSFTGQSFSILYKSGPGFGKVDVYVDDVLIGTINQNAATVTFQQRWDCPTQLASGNHSLKLILADTSKASLDAVIVRQ
jgi:hypothetical protein